MNGRGRLRSLAGWLAGVLALAAGVLAAVGSLPLVAALACFAGMSTLLATALHGRSERAARRESRALGAAMAGIASGDFSVRPGALTSEPLSPLQGPFAAMAESIAALFGQLGAQRGQLAAVMDTMADGVVLVDGDGRLVLTNRAAQELLGIGAGVGGQLSAVFRDHELRGLVAVCRQQRQQQRAELDLPSVRRTVSAITTPLSTDPNDAGPLVLLTLHDLTALRQLDTTRREFVANVSHELRSPLASVKAMVETLENGAVHEREIATDFLRRVHDEVDRMGTLVDGLLDLSRIESGGLELEHAPVDLATLAEGVRAGLEMRLSAVNVTVDIAADEPVSAAGDEGKLRQVLANLLDNALTFTPEGGRIRVRIDGSADPRLARVEVRDSGPGISPEHLPHLFERFYKVDRSRRDKGTGLGLAIAKHVVESHGGRMGVESEMGVGSTFWFVLPRVDAPDTARGRVDPELPAPESP